MEQPRLLVSENVFQPILALVEAAYGLLKLATLQEGTSAQPCQMRSLGLQIQCPSLPLTKKLGRLRRRWITAASTQWCSRVFFQATSENTLSACCWSSSLARCDSVLSFVCNRLSLFNSLQWDWEPDMEIPCTVRGKQNQHRNTKPLSSTRISLAEITAGSKPALSP